MLFRSHIWRVGSGQSINIWEDHWVPCSPSRKVETPRGQILLRHVEELIDQESGQWDEVLIRDIFNPIDVERILCIPLSANIDEDFVAWHRTRSYSFSV